MNILRLSTVCIWNGIGFFKMSILHFEWILTFIFECSDSIPNCILPEKDNVQFVFQICQQCSKIANVVFCVMEKCITLVGYMHDYLKCENILYFSFFIIMLN